MKILITYSSKTGNTKKVAYGLYEGLKDNYEIDIKDMKHIKDLSIFDDYAVLLIGFWIDKGTADNYAKKIIKQINNKNVGLFCTLGANPDSKHGKDVLNNMKKIMHKSNNIIEIALYNGLVDMTLLKKLKQHPPLFLPKTILKKMIDAGENSREPNEQDIQNAIKRFDTALKRLYKIEIL